MQNNLLTQSDLPLPLYSKGKVRDIYDLGSQLLVVATDRISAFDAVLPTGVPHKGQVLTALSAFWFQLTAGVAPNHMITTDRRQFPFDWRQWSTARQEQLKGRAMLVQKAQRIDIECVARGYLSGSAWEEYNKTGEVVGIKQPHGLEPNQQLIEPIFTPALKAKSGHDENVTFERMAQIVGQEQAEQLRSVTLRVYSEMAEHARQRGVIVADTKLEFGLLDGKLVIIDELGTPDSSRLWEVRKYRIGREQTSLDKQYVRDWLIHSGWNREPPAPALPFDVVQKTSEKYLDAYKQITGRDLLPEIEKQ